MKEADKVINGVNITKRIKAGFLKKWEKGKNITKPIEAKTKISLVK